MIHIVVLTGARCSPLSALRLHLRSAPSTRLTYSKCSGMRRKKQFAPRCSHQISGYLGTHARSSGMWGGWALNGSSKQDPYCVGERLFASAPGASYYEAVLLLLGVVVVISKCFVLLGEANRLRSVISPRSSQPAGITSVILRYASFLLNPYLCARPSRWQKWVTALGARQYQVL
ncbi:hypothetical protein LI328DRAFT_165525 [Trichoderma asperelloides]|nr:hypothetical protein LI328DRAFT_165525 [Trichoderma asperelloides]